MYFMHVFIYEIQFALKSQLGLNYSALTGVFFFFFCSFFYYGVYVVPNQV